MSLTNKQKAQLKSKAHHLKPIFQVGKNVVNNNFISQIDDVLEKRELIKISVLQNCLEDINDIAENIASNTHSEIVQIIGKTIIIYRESNNHKKIELV